MKLTNILLLSSAMIWTAACVDIEGPKNEALSPNDVLAKIKIRSEAIMIAKGDSHRINFDLIAMNNDTIAYDPKMITWTSSGEHIVSVNQDGVLYGRQESGSAINVIVKYLHKRVTKVDTVSVYVTEGKIDANAIRLISLDSNRVGGNALTGVPRVRIDLYKDGDRVRKGAVIPLQVTSPIKAVVDQTGGPDGEPVYRISNDNLLIGKFWIRSSINLYGTQLRDSLSFTGLYAGYAIAPVNLPPDDYDGPVPLLDTIPPLLYQVCVAYVIMSIASEPVDILFSDSTASSSDCEPTPAAEYPNLGFPLYGEFIGGNVMNLPPFMAAVRKSRTAGIVRYNVRKSSTGKDVPWMTKHIFQRDVED